jgi:prolyl-tRNA editing enzyme YbaK/EbsC (Cys-tRNA(Pro) deacylase)
MDIVENILKSANLEYEFIIHNKQIYSAMEGADYFHIEPGQTAPTLIIETDKGYFSVIFSGSRSHVDLGYIAKLLGISKIKLAKKNKLQQITGFAPGDTPMVGINLPVIFDKKLFQYDFVYGGSGKANRTLKISPMALITINQPIAFLEK